MGRTTQTRLEMNWRTQMANWRLMPTGCLTVSMTENLRPTQTAYWTESNLDWNWQTLKGSCLPMATQTANWTARQTVFLTVTRMACLKVTHWQNYWAMPTDLLTARNLETTTETTMATTIQ